MQTRYIAAIALFGAVLLGVMSYDRGLVPAMMERYFPDSVLYSGNLNTAIWERGEWARFALKGKKFYGPVYGCRRTLALALVQWTYAEPANLNTRADGRDKASLMWKAFVATGACVETNPQWYAVEDIRATPGAHLDAYSPGQLHTAPGMAKVRIDGWGDLLYGAVNIPVEDDAS